MTWFKVDDGFADHPKVDALLTSKHGAAALALWTLAGSWCAKHLTDGAVPSSRVGRFGIPHATLAAAELVRVGLWRVSADGFVFHDWTTYQPTRESVTHVRTKTAARVRRHRVTNADGNDGGNAVTDAVSNGAPVPSRPVPTKREPALDPSELDRTRKLAEFIRGGIQEGYREGMNLAIPHQCRDFTWEGWRKIARAVIDLAGDSGSDEETAAKLSRAFFADPRMAREGYPIAFLAENPNQFWRRAS